MRRFARVCLVASVALVLKVSAAPAAVPPDAFVHEVGHAGRTMTMRLTRVPLRGPHFELRVQRAGGEYRTQAAPTGERSYLGTVDGRPGAVATGVVTADGGFCGSIVFDRGGTWFVRDGGTERLAGLEAPGFAWPSTDTIGPGVVGDSVFAFDVAVDADRAFIDRAGSITRAFDNVECSMTRIRAIYLHDALLMPRLARVVLRADAASDPYAGLTDTDKVLSRVRKAWQADQSDAERDLVIAAPGNAGGGFGYLGGIEDGPGGLYSYVAAGADDGYFDNTGRHEVGHSFGNDDYEGGSAEGETIMNGNHHARFGGPELRTMMRTRDDRPWVFEAPVRFDAVPVAPYAALDLVPGPVATSTPIDVLANDHDANGDALQLLTVDAETAAGGTARLQNGQVIYEPPARRGRDSLRYVIADTCGQTATGVVLIGGSSGDEMPSPRHDPLGRTGPPLPCLPAPDPITQDTCRPGATPGVLRRRHRVRLVIADCPPGTAVRAVLRRDGAVVRRWRQPLNDGQVTVRIPKGLARGRYTLVVEAGAARTARDVRVR